MEFILASDLNFKAIKTEEYYKNFNFLKQSQLAYAHLLSITNREQIEENLYYHGFINHNQLIDFQSKSYNLPVFSPEYYVIKSINVRFFNNNYKKNFIFALTEEKEELLLFKLFNFSKMLEAKKLYPNAKIMLCRLKDYKRVSENNISKLSLFFQHIT